jgi:hypothetical protein
MGLTRIMYVFTTAIWSGSKYLICDYKKFGPFLKTKGQHSTLRQASRNFVQSICHLQGQSSALKPKKPHQLMCIPTGLPLLLSYMIWFKWTTLWRREADIPSQWKKKFVRLQTINLQSSSITNKVPTFIL